LSGSSDFVSGEETEVKSKSAQTATPPLSSYEGGRYLAKYIKTRHRCKCGASLILVNDSDLYDGDAVCCDVCHCDIESKKPFFHCEKDVDSRHHPHGFDVCAKCVLKNKKKSECETPQKQEKEKKNKTSKQQRPDKKASSSSDKMKSKEKAKRKKNRSKGKSKSPEAQAICQLENEKGLLLKANNKQSERIDFLQTQLKAVSKNKVNSDTTLKLVKNQVTELVLRNEKINHDLSEQQKQTAKLQPDSQWKVLCQIEAKLKGFKKEQGKKNKRVKANADKLESMEGIMTNLYRVFNNRYEKQQVVIERLQAQLNEKQEEKVGRGEVQDAVFLSDEEMEDEKQLNRKIREPQAKLGMYSQLAQDIEKELQEFEEAPLDQQSIDEAFNDLNEFKVADA